MNTDMGFEIARMWSMWSKTKALKDSKIIKYIPV